MTLVEELKTKKLHEQSEWLEIRNLKKTYGDFVAVNNINLSIKKGEFLTLLGGSGSGKTTTLLSVAGFLEPSEGEILLSGESILDKPPHKRNIGMVFQHYSLFPHMSIFDNVAFPLKMRKTPKKEIKEKVTDILKLVELEDFIERKPNQLSGGQQQRVALARALVFEPNILLMDEPLAALDKKLRETMQLEIRHLHEKLGLTIVYVTHDQEEALKMSDRIAIFDAGNIEQLGTPEELYDRPNSQFVAQFLGDSNAFKGEVLESNHGSVIVSRATDNKIKVSTSQSFSKFDNVVVMVRPEKIKMRKTFEKNLEVNQIKARVEELIYLGESYRFILKTEFDETILVKNQISLIDEQNYKVGDTAYITWTPQNAVILPSTN